VQGSGEARPRPEGLRVLCCMAASKVTNGTGEAREQPGHVGPKISGPAMPIVWLAAAWSLRPLRWPGRAGHAAACLRTCRLIPSPSHAAGRLRSCLPGAASSRHPPPLLLCETRGSASCCGGAAPRMRLQGNIARQRRDAARRFVLRQATGAQRDSACAPGPQLPPELRAQLALSGRRPSARAPGLKPPPQSWVSRAVRQPLPAADLRAAATSNASSPLPEREGD